MKQECEYLFCHEPATARVTVPHLKQRQCNCEEHLRETLAWANRYRHIPGAVQVEQLEK